jgi:uncharacterized SAM-binding protein YcdF (DUF218 family)
MLSSGRRIATENTGTRPPRRGLRVALLLLCLIVLAPVVGFVRFVESMPTVETPPSRNADGIVVLTGAAFRISDALVLLADGRGKRLLISGVNPATRSQEISRLMPEHQRLFSCCVDLDRSAINTIGNAIETRRWVAGQGFQSLIVVTSNFHMPRAMAELAYQLPGVTLVPYAVISERVRVETWWNNPSTTKLLFWEYVKYLAAPVRHWAGL